MTNQETFDKVVNALRAQNCKSVVHNEHGDEVCCYRGADGLKCAVGHLIPDEKYYPSLEGLGVHADNIEEILIELGYKDSIELLSELQDIHDSSSPQYWEEHFEIIAREYELSYTPKGS